MGQAVIINTSQARPRMVGIVIVILTFGIFGLWAAFAPLQSAALAPGTVTVKGSRKSIEHYEGGIVAEIPVREGDTVAAGDLLLRLDDTQARAQLEIAMGQYYAVKARESRLLAEREDRSWGRGQIPGRGMPCRARTRSLWRASMPTRARSPFCSSASNSWGSRCVAPKP
jgi:multidrug efflux pump subunit AcrA (membrane-fusion protein)